MVRDMYSEVPVSLPCCLVVQPETEELFPVYDATTFFTDMHRILRIVALGNVRTLCHHRLRLLEQVREQCMPCHVLFSFLAGRC